MMLTPLLCLGKNLVHAYHESTNRAITPEVDVFFATTALDEEETDGAS